MVTGSRMRLTRPPCAQWRPAAACCLCRHSAAACCLRHSAAARCPAAPSRCRARALDFALGRTCPPPPPRAFAAVLVSRQPAACRSPRPAEYHRRTCQRARLVRLPCYRKAVLQRRLTTLECAGAAFRNEPWPTFACFCRLRASWHKYGKAAHRTTSIPRTTSGALQSHFAPPAAAPAPRGPGPGAGR